jgi:hypothetical protein
MNTYTAIQAYDMWQHLQNMYDTPLNVSQADDYITQMRQLSIAEHIGFDEDTVHKFADKLILLNGKLDPVDRLNDTHIGNRILLAIMNSSSHLHNEARKELNALLPDRQFTVPPMNVNGIANVNAGHRDLTQLIHHFDNSWRDLIRAGYISKSGPSRPVTTAHRATDIALTMAYVKTDEANVAKIGDLAVALVDALNITTSEIICDNCQGAGHKRVQCPSQQRYCSIPYVTALLEAARRRADSRQPGVQRGAPRGQRPPFRSRPNPNANNFRHTSSTNKIRQRTRRQGGRRR